MMVNVMSWPPIKNLYVFFMKSIIVGFWIIIEKKLTFCLLDGVSDPVLEKGNDIWFGLKWPERQEEFLHDELYHSHIGIGKKPLIKTNA